MEHIERAAELLGMKGGFEPVAMASDAESEVDEITEEKMVSEAGIRASNQTKVMHGNQGDGDKGYAGSQETVSGAVQGSRSERFWSMHQQVYAPHIVLPTNLIKPSRSQPLIIDDEENECMSLDSNEDDLIKELEEEKDLDERDVVISSSFEADFWDGSHSS